MSSLIQKATADKLLKLLKDGRTVNPVHELIRGAGASVALNIGGRCITLLTAVILARTMGSHSYGIFVLVFSWMGLLVLPAKLGFDSVIVRYIPQYEAREEWGFLKGILIYAFLIILGGSIVIAVLLSGLITFVFRDTLNFELRYAFYLGALSLPLMAVANYARSALRGLRRIVLSQTADLIIRPTCLIFGAAVFYVIVGKGPNGYTAVGINGLAFLLAVAYSLFWLWRKLQKKVWQCTPNYQQGEWFSTALPLLLLSGISTLLNQTDKVMLGFLSNAESVGIYSIAHRITTLISFGLLAVNAIAGPMISRLYTSKQIAELQRTLGFAALGALICALPVILIILTAGRPILLFFGQPFLSAHDALNVLSVGQLANVMAGSVMLVMTMTGHHKSALYTMGSCALMNILFNALLIPSFGVNGAATATTLSMVLWNALMLIYVKRKMDLNPSVFSLIRLQR